MGVSSSTPARSRGRAPATADVGIVESLIGGLLIGFALLIGACLRTIWQAPMWVITLGSAGAVVYLVETERLAWAILLVTLWLALLVLFSLIRPTWLAWLRDRYVGQALGLVVYRPRWETACIASGLGPKLAGERHTPRLARLTRRGTIDVFTVRMCAGQTLADWRSACGGLASTFGAHTASVTEATKPGWVILEVIRRDPLADERTSEDPARQTAPAIVIGRDEYGRTVAIDAAGTPHVALQGASRAGKSSATYTLLAALAHRSDVIVCSVDPSGILLDPFARGRGGAYIATGTRAEDLDAAADTLARLVNLMDDRIAALLRRGEDKISTFTAALPAVWVVMEEFPGLLAAARALDAERGAKAGERLAPRLERSVSRLIKESAKVGFTVLILAQRMSANALDTDDRSNIAVRITLRVDNGDAVAMLHDGIGRDGIDRVRQFLPGVGIMESPGVPVRRVRMHYTDYATYRARVAAGIAAVGTVPLGRSDAILGLVVPARAEDEKSAA